MRKVLVVVLMAMASALMAQERRPAGEQAAAPATQTTTSAERPAAPKETPRDQISTTQHTVSIDGQTINYTARAQTHQHLNS